MLTVIPDLGRRHYAQLAFVRRFPVYVVTENHGVLTWWFRSGTEVSSLIFHDGGSELRVVGEAAVARRALNLDAAAALPAMNSITELAAPHQSLYQRFGGIRPIVFPDPFEGMAWAVLGQQITVRLAASMKAAIAKSWGTPVSVGHRTVVVFPSAARLASCSVDQLRALRLSTQKAVTLLSLARALAEGRLDASTLYREKTDAALDTLMAFKGIGPWTAEYCLLRVFGHPDVIPASDAGLKRAWARAIHVPRITEQQLRQAALPWEGWRSDFAFWLWLSNVFGEAPSYQG